MATRSENGMSVAEFQEAQRRISTEILQHCAEFMRHDIDIIRNLGRITETIADYITKNPDILVGKVDRPTFAQFGTEGGGPASAGDVTGGDALDEIERIIDLVKTALGDEKPFIKDIIKHVLGIG